MVVGCPSNGCRASSLISDILASPTQKMIPPPDIWGAPFRRLTCGPTKLTRTKGFVNLDNINYSSCSDRTMSIQQPSCFFNLWSSCSSRPKQHRSCRLLLPPMAGYDAAEASPPPTIPTAGQALRRRQRNRTSEPSYSSPRGHPLPRLPRLRVVHFLGLAVVHRRGALHGAWSTWSRNGFHRTWTVRGEADSWVHGRSKELPPYYAQNNDSFS